MANCSAMSSTEINSQSEVTTTRQLFIRYARQLNGNNVVVASTRMTSYKDDPKTTKILDKNLQEIDQKLDMLDLEKIQESLESLTGLSKKFPENLEFLWRIGKAHHKLAVATTNQVEAKDHVFKGLNACKTALQINPDNFEAHKWAGILIGVRSTYQPIKEKIADGYLYKEHMDKALSLNSNDATVHHMIGRFAFTSASLRWYARKIATAFFGEPPSSTFEEALESFFEADKILNDWKENKLFIAKCQIALGRYEEAVDTLLKAQELSHYNLDSTIDTEVNMLLKKYIYYKK